VDYNNVPIKLQGLAIVKDVYFVEANQSVARLRAAVGLVSVGSFRCGPNWKGSGRKISQLCFYSIRYFVAWFPHFSGSC